MKQQLFYFCSFVMLLLLGWFGAYYFYVHNSIALPVGEIPILPFYFIRHGQTDDNLNSLVSGLTDTHLNANGIAQAHTAAKILEKTDIQTIVSSPLQRAYKTAEIIAEALHKPIIVMDEFKERCAGSFEGQPEGQPSFIAWFFGKSTASGAEEYTHFVQRIVRGLKKALSLPGPVLIVSHGGVFYIMQNLLPLNKKQYINNATPLFIYPLKEENIIWEALQV